MILIWYNNVYIYIYIYIIYLFVYLFIYLFIYIFIYLYVYTSLGEWYAAVLHCGGGLPSSGSLHVVAMEPSSLLLHPDDKHRDPSAAERPSWAKAPGTAVIQTVGARTCHPKSSKHAQFLIKRGALQENTHWTARTMRLPTIPQK